MIILPITSWDQHAAIWEMVEERELMDVTLNGLPKLLEPFLKQYTIGAPSEIEEAFG